MLSLLKAFHPNLNLNFMLRTNFRSFLYFLKGQISEHLFKQHLLFSYQILKTHQNSNNCRLDFQQSPIFHASPLHFIVTIKSSVCFNYYPFAA